MKLFILLLFSSALLFSCSHDQATNAIVSPFDEATSGVKSRIFYPSLEPSQVLSREDFEYDGRGRLWKKTYYSGDREFLCNYELFQYGETSQPQYRLGYYANANPPSAFFLLDSTIYTYNAGLLVTAKTTYPSAGYSETDAYEYAGRLPVKKTRYHNEDLERYTTYEYTDGLIRKEVDYSNDSMLVQTRQYGYQGVVRVETVYYTFRGEAMRKVSYTYNDKGKLIYEMVDELLPYSSSLPYVVRYLY